MPFLPPQPARLVHRLPVVAALAVCAGAILMCPRFTRAADAAAPPATEATREREVGRAVERGLNWLAAEWEKGGVDKPEKNNDVVGRGNVATASLAGLAFLQDGAEPGKGRY